VDKTHPHTQRRVGNTSVAWHCPSLHRFTNMRRRLWQPIIKGEIAMDDVYTVFLVRGARRWWCVPSLEV